uniref:Protein serine/threonine phosphatase 2C C-terminal domain-containing protein n=1 Tax=Sinocyclocheilus grahami TaxID=75366 RepID=A0A672M284_SINGR
MYIDLLKCIYLAVFCEQNFKFLSLQGSLDNISITIICFDGAPKVTPEALQQEAELERVIESKDEEPDLLYVMKFLASENIPGLPPNGGISCK